MLRSGFHSELASSVILTTELLYVHISVKIQPPDILVVSEVLKFVNQLDILAKDSWSKIPVDKR